MAEIVIGIDDQDLQKVANGMEVAGSVGGAAGEVSKNVKELGTSTQEASEQTTKGSEGAMSSLGKLAKLAGAAALVGKVFSAMSQVSGPFIAATARLNIVFLKIGKALGDGLGPVLDIVVDILHETIPLFKVAGEMIKSFVAIVRPFGDIMKRFKVEIIAGIATFAAYVAVQKAFIAASAIGGPVAGGIAAVAAAGVALIGIKKLIDELTIGKDVVRGGLGPVKAPGGAQFAQAQKEDVAAANIPAPVNAPARIADQDAAAANLLIATERLKEIAIEVKKILKGRDAGIESDRQKKRLEELTEEGNRLLEKQNELSKPQASLNMVPIHVKMGLA